MFNLKKLSMGLGLLIVGFILTDVPNALDARFYYSALEAQNYLTSLSEDLRQVYIKHELVDLLFISTYSILFFNLMKLTVPDQKRIHSLSLIPGFFDLIETLTILFLLVNRDYHPTKWLGVYTCLKWSTGIILLTAIVLKRLIDFKGKSQRIQEPSHTTKPFLS